MTILDLRILILNEDLRAARAAWLSAHERDQPVERVTLLFDDIERLTHAQVQQVDDDVRRYFYPGPAIEGRASGT